MNQNDVLVIVDAGHGGVDSGAVGNNLQEKNLNLQAAKYMYQRLQELGIPVKMTRVDDEYLPKDKRIQRVRELSNNNPNTLLISNHINAGGGEGAEIVYALRNSPTLAQMAIDNIGAAGQKKRKIYQRRLPENPSQDYYYIIRDTSPLQSILVEYGFIDNANDSNKLKNNLNDYVEGVVKAIADYLNVPYNLPNMVPTVSDQIYVVKNGDTLYSIGRRYNISVDELKRINNLTNNQLSVGQQLYLVPLQDDIISDNYVTYVVKRGDSLSSIASNFNTSVNAIKQINNLPSDIIMIGQQLLVPSNNDDVQETVDGYEEYVVQRGDSLTKIATLFNTDINSIKKINDLTSNTIFIGQVLKVPNVVNDNNSGEVEYQEYVVKRGDSLWKIARDFNTTVNQILELNMLDSANLQIGDVLKIPVDVDNSIDINNYLNDNSFTNSYVVKQGDSLWSIARQYGVSVNDLKAINNLNSNLLSIGQELIIP